jgi:D-arabinose 1-dehydrogenase-like Zn-dependent alcohol dehydrogenase
MQPSLTYPCVMGHEIVGTIVDINGDSAFAIGDAVVIDPSFRCGACIQCTSGKENICSDLKVLVMADSLSIVCVVWRWLIWFPLG